MADDSADERFPPFNVPASAADWLSDVEKILAGLERYIEALHRIKIELQDLIRRNAANAVKPGASNVEVRAIVYSLDWLPPRHDDSIEVRINGTNYFLLRPRLAQVFMFLAGASGESGDDLSSWRSRKEVVEFMRKKTNKNLRTRYVNNLIHQLREALHKHGHSPLLIQTNREKGIRLALKRPGCNVIASGQV